MALTYKARRRWSLVILLSGMPLYIVAAVSLMNAIDRPSIWAEFAIYLVLGILWALPFRFVFRGVAQPDPAAAQTAADPSRGGERPPRD